MTTTEINVSAAIAPTHRRAEKPKKLRHVRRQAGLIGIVGVVALWWLVSAVFFSGPTATVPSPIAVVHSMFTDGWAFYGPNVSVTGMSALQGFLIGNILAVVAATIAVLIPRAEGIVMQLGVISYCVPLLALGPLILVLFGGRAPSIFLAAIAVFFTSLVGTVTGLKAADPASMDVVTAAGGRGWQRIVRVQLIASLPHLIGSFKIAAPAAVLGAILGEYLGGVDSGLGVSLTAAQAAFNIPRTWGIALVAGLLAVLAFGLLSLVESLINRRLFGGAAVKSAGVGFGETKLGATHGILGTIASVAWPLVMAVVVVVVVWVGVLVAFPQIGPLVGKYPTDVWAYVFGGADPAAVRHQLWGDLAITLRDTGIGFVAGMVLAMIGASIMAASAAIQQTVMPIATALRAMPLVAMTPIIVLIFGRGVACVAVVGILVVVFPAMVLMVTGLKSAPQYALDVISANGGGVFSRLRFVSVPFSIPSLFSAARVSVPGALIAALVTEWLGTGKGAGSTLIAAIPAFDYDLLWTTIVVVTGASIILYTVVAAIERLVTVALAGGRAR